VTNLRVGVKVLQECIQPAPARSKVACATTWAQPTWKSDGGYAGKVLAEHQRLLQVAGGKAIPLPSTRRYGHPHVAPPMPRPAVRRCRAEEPVPERQLGYTSRVRDWR
jgi:hypothetical protein